MVAAMRAMGVTAHVAQHKNGRRSAIDGRTTRCTAPGFLDTELHYAARLMHVSSQTARASSGLR